MRPSPLAMVAAALILLAAALARADQIDAPATELPWLPGDDDTGAEDNDVAGATAPPPGAADKISSNQWLTSGELGIGGFRVVGAVLDVAAAEHLTVTASVGAGHRPEASGMARVTSGGGPSGVGVGAALSAESTPILSLRPELWSSLTACAWTRLRAGWHLEAFVGAAEAIERATATQSDLRRFVGGFYLAGDL